jgi:hypothetical protein
LGYDLSVISTETGAIGIPVDITGGKLLIVADSENNQFASEITLLDTNKTIPSVFFSHFYWDNIAVKAANILNK